MSIRIGAFVAISILLLAYIPLRNRIYLARFGSARRELVFPDGPPAGSARRLTLGDIFIRKSGTDEGWRRQRLAQGTVSVPADAEVRLVLQYESEIDLVFADTIEPESIDSLILYYDIAEARRPIDDEALCRISKLRGLKELDIYANSGDPGFAFFDAAESSISRKGVSCLKNLPHLRSLHLTGEGIDAEALDELAGCHSLRELKLSSVNVNGVSASDFRRKRPDCLLAIE